MASKTLTVLEDDIDGAAGAQPTTFGLAGRVYEIDSSPENAAKLEQALNPLSPRLGWLPPEPRFPHRETAERQDSLETSFRPFENGPPARASKSATAAGWLEP